MVIINWSPTFSVLFNKIIFSFLKRFLSVSSGVMFKQEWINYRLYLSWVKLNPRVFYQIPLIIRLEESLIPIYRFYKITYHKFLWSYKIFASVWEDLFRYVLHQVSWYRTFGIEVWFMFEHLLYFLNLPGKIYLLIWWLYWYHFYFTPLKVLNR